MGPPCRMKDGTKMSPTVQYGWSRWLMNMLVRVWGDLHDKTKIKVTFRKWPKNSLEYLKTWVSSKDRGKKTKPDGANDIPNEHQMTLWCTKEAIDQMGA